MQNRIMTKKQSSTISNIKSFLRTLLGKRHKNIPLDVSLSGNNIKVTVPKAHEKTITDLITQDPRKNLPYKLTSSKPTVAAADAGQETITIDFDLPPLDTAEAAKKIMLNLFGHQAFKVLKLDLEETFKGARLENGVLYLQSNDDRDVADVLMAMQKYLCSYFLNIPRSKIQDAYLGRSVLTKQKLPTSTSVIPQGPLSGCFGVSQQHGAEMFINLDRLQKLIFPPTITQRPLTDDKVELTFETKHFHAYMEQFSKNGLLLQLTGPDDPHLRPLIISTPRVTAKKPTHRILVDLSYSMESVLPNAKDFLKKLVKRSLAEGSPEVILTPFGTKIGAPISFNQQSTVSDIDSQIDALQLMAGTGLYDAIKDQLDNATAEQLAGDEEYVLTIVSDGRDNIKVPAFSSWHGYSAADVTRHVNAALQAIHDKIKRFRSSNPPRIFVVGIGAPKEIDHEFLKDLALTTSSIYQHIKVFSQNPKDLDDMLDDLSDMFTPQNQMELAIKIAGKGRKSYTLSVPATGEVQLPDISFPFKKGENPLVTFNGEEFLVNPNIDEIPEPDFLDHLVNIKTEAHLIVMHPQLSLDEKSQRLAHLKEKMTILKKSDSAKNQESEIDRLNDHLESIATELDRAKVDPASFSSFQTRIRRFQGGAEETVEAQCTTLPGGPGVPCEVDGVTPAKHNSLASKIDTTIPSLIKWAIPYAAASMVRNWFRGTPTIASTAKPPKKAVPTASTTTVHASLQAEPAIPAAPKRSYALTKAPAPLSFDEKIIVANAACALLGINVGEKISNTTTWALDTVMPSHWDKPVTEDQFLILLEHGLKISTLKAKLKANSNNEYLKMYTIDHIKPAEKQLAQLKRMIVAALKTSTVSPAHLQTIQEMYAAIEDVISRTNEIIDVIKEGCKRAKKTGMPVDFHTARDGTVTYRVLSFDEAMAKKRADSLSQHNTQFSFSKKTKMKFWHQPDPTQLAKTPDLPLLVSATKSSR